MATQLLSGAMGLLGILFWIGKYSCKILAFVTEESRQKPEVIVLEAKARSLKHQPLGSWLQLIK